MDYQWLTWPDLIATVERAPGLLSPWAVAQIRALSSSYRTAAGADQRPQLQDADVTATLASVSRLLSEQIDELALLWRELGGQAPEVLAQDLPAWLDDLLRQGGKRLRPAMCHWGYVAAGADIGGPGHAEMVRAATALELLHQFALLHDDVMDESDLRRGGPPHTGRPSVGTLMLARSATEPPSDGTSPCCSVTSPWCRRIGSLLRWDPAARALV